MVFRFWILTFCLLLCGCAEEKPVEPIEALVYQTPKQIKPFVLQDQFNNDVTEKALLGKWSLLFLGYTSCPDICPMTLAKLQYVFDHAEIDNLTVWFVSVDPQRDTLEKRASYINYFNPQFLAVSAPHASLFPFVRNIGLVYAMTESQAQSYSVDHSASVALVNPKGHLHAIFKPEFKHGAVPTINQQKMLVELKAIIKRY